MQFILVLGSLLLGACHRFAYADIGDMRVNAPLVPVNWDQVQGWSQDDVRAAYPALLNNCKVLTRIAKAAAWHGFCIKLNNAPQESAALRTWLQNELSPYQIGAAGKQGKITGYYEPIISCNKTKTAEYAYAVYGPPKAYYNVAADGGVSRKGVAIPERAELMQNGSLNGYELMYCADAVELYFMQVQGSGTARLPNGQLIRLAYAANNTHPSQPIAKWLAAQGAMRLEQTSKDNIKVWAKAHPERLEAMLNSNPRFVFFRELAMSGTTQGSPGTLGVPLTAGRSVAIDTQLLPLGVPLFLSTLTPAGAPMQVLVAAQDTGAAIKGAPRADFYWGFDDYAASQAHRMRQPGQMWLLWPVGARP